jgi:hypothetical protein
MLSNYTFLGSETFFEKRKAKIGPEGQLARSLELHEYVIKNGLPKHNKNIKSIEYKFYVFLASMKMAFKNNDHYQTTKLYSKTKKFLLEHGYLN